MIERYFTNHSTGRRYLVRIEERRRRFLRSLIRSLRRLDVSSSRICAIAAVRPERIKTLMGEAVMPASSPRSLRRVWRILIGCETSGVARRAFAARGHDVWSCDILPAEDGSNRHLVGDIRDYLNDGGDLLALLHPPCTRLCNSGVRWLSRPPRGKTLEQMWCELEAAVDLFNACWNAPIERVAVENPVMHGHARKRIIDWRKPQIVQPWWFGDPAFKATGFYLRRLPKLIATDRLTPPLPGTDEHKAWSHVHRAPPGPDRWRLRSRSFEGMMSAMAEQWTPDMVGAAWPATSLFGRHEVAA